MCDKTVNELLVALERSEAMFARAYLQFRGRESKPGRPLSVEDARANAVLFCQAEEVELPETIRYRLHAALAIERSVEPS